jgi:hypothetical protein
MYDWCVVVDINKLIYVKQVHGICIILSIQKSRNLYWSPVGLVIGIYIKSGSLLSCGHVGRTRVAHRMWPGFFLSFHFDGKEGDKRIRVKYISGK